MTLKNGDVLEGTHVVVCCGPKTLGFYPKEGYKVMETEYFIISDPSGLPPSFYEFEPHIYSGLSGATLGEYKIGLHETRDSKKLLDYIAERMPSKIEKVTAAQPCYYTYNENSEFVYEQKNGIFYAFGFDGSGFKHMPMHGKKIYDLIKASTAKL